MQQELEQRINDIKSGNEIKLTGKIKFNINRSGSFTVGRLCVKGIIQIMRSDITINGEDAEIEVDVDDCTTSDWSLFFVHPTARNVQFNNLRIKVRIQNPENTTRTFSLIYNTAYGVKLHNCQVEMYSDKQINLVGIYNNGNLDTHMETRADNLVIDNCLLKVECRANEFTKECAVYGVYNYLANSISMQNTFIYATNKGNGERQKAVGVYTNGRFGRFAGNNIKANASHNVGREKEQAYAFGFINEGLYSIISANNIVGEWAGMSVGLENCGEYAIVAGNKILATHTICGRTIRNYGSNTSIEDNAFAYCSGITNITIPDGVTSIGYRAFYNCSGLTKIYYKGSESEWDTISIDFYNEKLKNATRYYYSAEKPTASGNYWHYKDNGEIEEW